MPAEGRIDPATKRLQCSYHGWQFGGDGRCAALPQADSERQLDVARTSSRSCVAAYPARVQQVTGPVTLAAAGALARCVWWRGCGCVAVAVAIATCTTPIDNCG